MSITKFKHQIEYQAFLVCIDNFTLRKEYEQEMDEEFGGYGEYAWEYIRQLYIVKSLLEDIFGEELLAISSNTFLVKFKGTSKDLLELIKVEALYMEDSDDSLNKTLVSQVYISPILEMESFTMPLMSTEIEKISKL